MGAEGEMNTFDPDIISSSSSERVGIRRYAPLEFKLSIFASSNLNFLLMSSLLVRSFII